MATKLSSQKLKKLVLATLNDYKGENIVDLKVGPFTSIADYIIICTGTSNRHVKALASHVVEDAKANKYPVIGVEGAGSAEWMLVDLGDVLVHIMQPVARDFYQLEKLWTR